jgi:hypothetical protein
MNKENELAGNWAIVELMGHKVLAGFISKDEEFGRPMLRVDVPETSAYPAYTQKYGTDAIYCITPVSEEVAKITAEENQTNPISIYVPDLDKGRHAIELVERLKEELTDANGEISRLNSLLPTGEGE